MECHTQVKDKGFSCFSPLPSSCYESPSRLFALGAAHRLHIEKKRKKIHIETLSETPFLTLRPQAGVPVLTPLIRRSHTKPGRDNCDSSAACPSLSLSTFLFNERRQQLSLSLISQVRQRRCPTVEEPVRSSGDP